MVGIVYYYMLHHPVVGGIKQWCDPSVSLFIHLSARYPSAIGVGILLRCTIPCYTSIVNKPIFIKWPFFHVNQFSLGFLVFGRPYYRSSLWYTVSSVCLSSSVRLSVTFRIVAKRYVLAKKCLKERIGNQGQRVDFLGRRRISTSGFAATATETAVFALFLPVQPSNQY